MNVEWLERVDSTNAELARRALRSTLDDFTVLVTADQTAGRGRLGRTWSAPPGATIAVSIFLRPGAGTSWLPLLAGLAMTRAVRGLIPDGGARTELKWPNDVLVDGDKISGLLGEIAADGAVMGAGLNVAMTEEQLPVATATSLTLAGADPDGLAERALEAYLGEFERAWRSFADAHFDVEAGLRGAVSAACGTLGRQVRVELPGGRERYGSAVAIDREGRLVVRNDTEELVVAAGDVTHVRAV